MMASIRGRGNQETEVRVAQIFRRHGIKGWRRHSRLLGKPDFTFRKERVAVFVDRCFWHGCREHSRLPKSNAAYWRAKLNMPVTATTPSEAQLRCPIVPRWKGDLVGCGSTNLSGEDDEGLFDCLDCGLFFTREAASNFALACPARLKAKRICRSTNLVWHENEQQLECIACGCRFARSKAVRLKEPR